MPRSLVPKPSSARDFDVVPVYPEELAAAIQQTLATLADVEHLYEKRRKFIHDWTGPDAEKQILLDECEVLHRRDREPLVLRLADLHERTLRVTVLRTIH
ncbi:MAG TPA: hypothetical protein VH743_09340 [Beijerinckiaceae bacterium]|jgi:hypothetical protein